MPPVDRLRTSCGAWSTNSQAYAEAIDFYSNVKRKFMRSILYILAVILIIGWLLGVFVYSAKGLIHILIVLAIISLLVGIIRRGDV
jgi:hypothetical protein